MTKQLKSAKTLIATSALASLSLALTNTVYADEALDTSTSTTNEILSENTSIATEQTSTTVEQMTNSNGKSTELSSSSSDNISEQLLEAETISSQVESVEQETAVATAQTNLTDATDLVNILETKLEDYQTQVTKALTSKTQAEKEFEIAQTALNSTDDNKYPSQIKLSQDWLDNFKILRDSTNSNLINLNKPEIKQAFDKLNTLEDSSEEQNPFTVFGEKPTYQYLISEDKAIYDMNNLPDELKIRLNLYFAKLVNSIHEQLGDDQKMQINKNLMGFADVVSNGYANLTLENKNNRDEWDKRTGGHHTLSINTGAEKFGFQNGGHWNYYENLSSSPGHDAWIVNDKVTEEFLFSWVYSAVKGFFLHDGGERKDGGSEFGHALSLIRNDTQGISVAWNNKILNTTLSAISGSKSLFLGTYGNEYVSLTKEYRALEETNEQKAQEVYNNETYIRLRDERLTLAEQIDQLTKQIPSRFSSDEPNYDYYKSLFDQRYELREQLKNLNEEISVYENEFYRLKGAKQYEPYLQKLEELSEKIYLEYEERYGVNSSYNIKEFDNIKELEESYRQAQERLTLSSQQYNSKLQELNSIQKNLNQAKEQQKQAQLALEKAETIAENNKNTENQPAIITEEIADKDNASNTNEESADKENTSNTNEESADKENTSNTNEESADKENTSNTSKESADKENTSNINKETVANPNHLAQRDPKDYAKLVAKVNQAMTVDSSQPSATTDLKQATVSQAERRELPKTASRDSKLLTFLGLGLLGFMKARKTKNQFNTD
ncbi:hypothetical protein [Streptococcus sp. sy004]|uniref:hypothetical protein n=1 Tax=Streptococcus sp. sy004 TaxID=2600149 RepID=UPI0011B3C4A8|nr:hypothetical protein [Streptococcus sp. sy004]TWT11297.1 hypothetical protein FRX54_03360 [Streptococcus sp. sy004]